LLMVDNVNILYVNKQEKWFKYKNIHRSRVQTDKFHEFW
jgi:hypothetical protein